jgi:hypothetical protein
MRVRLYRLITAVLIVSTGCIAWQAARRPATLTQRWFSVRTIDRPLVHADLSLASACRAAGAAYPPSDPRVTITKRERVLRLYSGKSLVREYPFGLGSDPIPDKQREGDGRTPAGRFFVCTRLGSSRWHRFLGLSYPAPEDGRRGLAEGLITPREEEAIRLAHRLRRRPPWNTRLGGEIGIHGGGSGADWTAGCIALDNDAVTELFPVLPLGTPVQIE